MTSRFPHSVKMVLTPIFIAFLPEVFDLMVETSIRSSVTQMQEQKCQVCVDLLIFQWKEGPRSTRSWQQTRAVNFHIEDPTDISSILPVWSKVCIMYFKTIYSLEKFANLSSVANSRDVEKCSQCRQSFVDMLHMPPFWWSYHFRNGNGSFGVERTRRSGFTTGFSKYKETAG